MYTGGHGKSRRSSSALPPRPPPPPPRLLCFQRSGKFRLILILKRINLHISPSHFRMETLPFGLKPAPRLFTRLVACVAAFLRQQGLRVFCYLDDWLLAAESRGLLSRQLHFLLRTAQGLGFIVNWEKSELTPSRHPTFLGAAIDLPRQLARPSPDRVNTIMAAALRLRRRRQAPVRVWLHSWVSSKPSRCAPGLPAAHASTAATPTQALLPLCGFPHAASAPSPVHPPASHAVVVTEISDYRQLPADAPALYHGDHRCLPAGMGWSLPGQYGFWGLAPYGHARSHQFVGVPSCPLTPLLFAPATPAHSAHTHRQCQCGGLYKQAGGHSLHAVERPSGATVDVVQTGGVFPYGVPYPRPGQPHSGLPVPGPSPSLGVDPPPDGHGPDGAGDRPFGGGSVRIRTQCSPPEVLLQGPGPSSLEDRRLLLPMEGVPGLCLPADLPHSPRTAEDSRGSGVGGANSTAIRPRRNWDLIGLLAGSPRTLPLRPDLIAQPISQALHPRLSALHLTAWPLSGRPAHRRAFPTGLPP